MALVGVYICAFGSAGLSGRPGVASAQRGPGDAGVRPFTRRFRAFGARARKRVSGAFGASVALPGGCLCSLTGRSGSVGFRVVALCHWAYAGGVVGGGAGVLGGRLGGFRVAFSPFRGSFCSLDLTFRPDSDAMML